MLAIGLTWGALWAAVFGALSIATALVDPDSIDPGEGPIRVGTIDEYDE